MVSATWFYILVNVTAAVSIGLGVLFPAIGQARAAAAAAEATSRQPDESDVISRTLYIGLAMIESQALYVLIVALILLFANPLEGRVSEAAAQGGDAMWFLVLASVGAAVAINLGTMLASIGQGKVVESAVESIAEQPEAQDEISRSLYISLALLESLALYALIVSLILLYANPLLETALGAG
jgi:F-type H+-transporting ATPase subunit c